MAITNPVNVKNGASVGDNFFSSIATNPNFNKNTLNLGDIFNSSSGNGIPGLINTVSNAHGVWANTSSQLQNWTSRLTGINSNLDNAIGSINQASSLVGGLLSNSIGLIDNLNNFSFAALGTPFLRHYVSQMDMLHPFVRGFFDSNLDKFPYFKPVSDSIGMFFNVVFDTSVIPLLDRTLKSGILNFKTNSPLRKNLHQKVYPEFTQMIDGIFSKADNLFIRKLPEAVFGKLIKEVTDPIAHGYSLGNDIFHAARILASKNGSLAELLGQFSDQLRLLDTFFPVVCQTSIPRKTYEVKVGDETVITNLLGDKLAVTRPQEMKNLGAFKEGLENPLN